MPRLTRSKGLLGSGQKIDIPVKETAKGNRKRPVPQKTQRQNQGSKQDEEGAKYSKKIKVSDNFLLDTEEILIPKTEDKTERTDNTDTEDQLFPFPLLTEAQIKKEIIETDSESSSSSDSDSSDDESDNSTDESGSSSSTSDSESDNSTTPSQENGSKINVSNKKPKPTSFPEGFKQEAHLIVEPLTVLPYKGKKRGPKRKKPIKIRDPNKPIRKSPGQPWDPIPCPHCSKTFRYISHLRQHSSAHSKERPFVCDECGKSFKRNNVLEEHRALFHLDLGSQSQNKIRSYSCSFCQKSCPNSYELKLHLRTHTGEKPFTCHICERSFSVARTLKIHLRRHAGEKPFKCTVADCDKAFAIKLELQRHLRRAHDAGDKGVRKPVQCEECGRSFSHIGILKDHILIHKGIKPFQCPFCDKCFRQSNHLDHHIGVHKWDAEHCGSPFGQQLILN